MKTEEMFDSVERAVKQDIFNEPKVYILRVSRIYATLTEQQQTERFSRLLT